MLLDDIYGPEDLKRLDEQQLNQLASEIRQFIIEKTSEFGGHLASNLGVVDLTIGLYRALDLPHDKLVWDVGHQAYTHKILSGRKDNFDGLRQYHGMSGFPKRSESPYDCFGTGHSSTSISAGLGIAAARDIKGEDYTVVSVIGDGALTGGLAYEGLNNASRMKKNFIIVLNDNNMSISQNVGGISKYLNGLRSAKGYNRLKVDVGGTLLKLPVVGERLVKHIQQAKKSIKQLVIPGMFFEDMGITYLGPIDGHNIKEVERTINEAKKIDHAVLVHVLTQKGRGYKPAERYPSRYHGVSPFDVHSGKPLSHNGKTYTEYFSDKICELAKENKKIVGITAAMPDGTGLSRFAHDYPNRFFDVGIAEQHAVTCAAGMASNGLKPVIAVYSSFLQRAYDQIVHDVCLQKLPVVFCIDRAGLVGSDGETHQGIFDYSFLTSIPHMSVMAPKNATELQMMMEFAMKYPLPVSIRYPRGVAYQGLSEFSSPIEYGKSEMLFKGEKIALLAAGSMVSTAEHIRDKALKCGYDLTLVNARFVKPIDTDMLDLISLDHEVIVTLEENVKQGGFGIQVEAYIHENHPEVKVVTITLPDKYVEHGNVTKLREGLGIDSESIMKLLNEKGIIDFRCREQSV
ncbi:1-deoxy-D-xylulose-5-phosphate synthase [Oribacterium sp. P6A1]|uniref:1-deoxy-D-xylulose-5-phosphate synthase n=1 Tax=Oribacterium sp. P6A1 TaxID=1410612 RepID=UPI0005617B0D|nr:1-deoxy-D-xylulose-5-phosphate synthase [Oribacterium sp. P6A1]